VAKFAGLRTVPDVATEAYSGDAPLVGGADDAEMRSAVSEALGEDAGAEFDQITFTLGDPVDIARDDGSTTASDAVLDRYVRATNSFSGHEHVTALSAFGQNMSRFRPLPTPAEQGPRLAAYRAGAAAARKLAGGRAGMLERRKLTEVVRAGEDATTELLGSMYRLEMIIARELSTGRFGRERATSMMPDLVGEANVALMEALSTYSEERCPSFSIYAARVMRDRIRMTLQNMSPITISAAWLRLKRVYVVLRPEVEMALGRHPNTSEMQEALAVRCYEWAANRLTDEQRTMPEGVQQALMTSKLRKQGMLGAIEKLDTVLSATTEVASLDVPVTTDGVATLTDMITSSTDGSEFDAIEHAQLHEDLMAALAELTDRERTIVLYRFGFADGESWTYAKLAPRFGVSPERIRQIERNAVLKLRGPAFAGLAGHLASNTD